MDKKTLQDTFREYKRATKAAGVGVDFAISSPSSYDTSTVTCNIIDKYGHDSFGIWTHKSEDLSKDNVVYVNHDLTDAQVGIFYSIFSKNYNIIPSQSEFAKGWAFQLTEKDTPVWAIHMDGERITPNSTTTSRAEAERRVMDLGIVVQRIF